MEGIVMGVRKLCLCWFLVYSLLLLFGFANKIKAEPVDVERARAVALTQLQKVTGDVGLRSAASLELAYESKNAENRPYFYVFNGNSGFVIVSGDDRVAPVLGYSDEGCFDPDNIPPNMVEFLKGYQKEIDFAIQNDIKADSELQTQWTNLKNGDEVQIRSYTSGDYLIKTSWGQTAPYNNYCPVDSSVNPPKRSFTGCHATAMAQIIRYWGADKALAPTHGFNGFETAYYDYDNMSETLLPSSDSILQHAVALLSYHCGVASKMDYSASPKGSQTNVPHVLNAFIRNFGYSDVYSVSSAYGISLSDFKRILKGEIDKEQPVIYAGYNHSFICDGYNSSDQFHMNWGYKGDGNGWYLLTSLIYEHDYSYHVNNVSIICNIYPVRDINISTNNRPIVYVSPNGSGIKDGSSWENARSDLHNVVREKFNEPKQIWVKEGIYYGEASAGSAAFVIGENNRVYGGFEGYESSLDERKFKNPSILDGRNICQVLCQTADFTSSNISIWDGFTIQNGLNSQETAPTAIEYDTNGNGGGIYLKKNGIIKNCIIKNCNAKTGGGVFNHGGCIIDCSFYNNEAEHAGALYNSSEGIVQLNNCIIENNKATSLHGGIGGGISNYGKLYIYENTFVQNNSGSSGGGIYNHGSLVMYSGCIINNKGADGAGIYSDGNITMYNSMISHNEASRYGGGLYISTGVYNINGGEISNNEAITSGGGIYGNSGLIYLTDSVKIQKNFASNQGGGICLNKGNLYLGDAYIGVETARYSKNKEEALISGGNVAKFGGGIYLNSTDKPYIQYIEGADAFIGGNFAENGGGIFITTENTSAQVVFSENITICGNTAINNGGGIYCARNVTLKGCTIKYNNASNGGGIYNDSGTFGELSLTVDKEAVLINNIANQEGGGIYNVTNLNISGGIITSNEANRGGGIYNVGHKSYKFSMSGGKVAGNTASRGAGIYCFRGGNYNLSDEANISDVIYLYNIPNYLSGGSLNTYLNINSLTFHVDYTAPISIQLEDPTLGIHDELAKYISADSATEAVNKNVFVVVNEGWRPVASSVFVKVERYTPPVTVDNVIYVAPKGVGRKDGTSWANATSDLYSEVIKDRTDSVEIWVKEGIYYGDTAVCQGGNKAAFILGKRNKVYGGFAGNESSLETRSGANPSILDGQNLRRVLCQLTDFTNADSSFIDGFTIRNGLDTIVGTANVDRHIHNGGADMTGNGGGVYLRKNGILINCIVKNCKARSGGGVFNQGGKVIGCSFDRNDAEHAGGLFNNGFASLKNCIITDNVTLHKIGYGGGIYNMGKLEVHDGASVIDNKGIIGNGLYTHANGVTTMYGGEISDNVVGQTGMGGGVYNDGRVTIYGGNIRNNQARGGGGITNHGTLMLYGGNISNNISTSYGGGIYSSGTLNIEGASVNVSGNLAYSYGGGIASTNGNLTFIAGIIGTVTAIAPETPEDALAMGGNVALGYDGGGGIYVTNNNKNISFTNSGRGDIIIGGNYANSYGGGLYITSATGFTLPSNVSICGNTSNSSGGGICTSNSASNVLLNGCNISYNKSSYNGAGVFNYSYLSMTDGKINNNEALNYGGAILNKGTFSISGGEIDGNSANLGDGIYNDSRTYVNDYAKVKDVMYVPGSSYAINLGNLTYHTDNSKPITIQGKIGNCAIISSLAQQYINQGILITTPGLYPVVQNTYYVYLYNDGTRSMELSSATDNGNIGVEKLAVYPTLINTGEKLTIESPERGRVFIWSLSGMLMGQYDLEKGKTQIPAPSLEGNYLVKVKPNDGEEKTIKIVVR